MRCAIWYHLYNFKKVKNARGGVLILVKLVPNRATHHMSDESKSEENIFFNEVMKPESRMLW